LRITDIKFYKKKGRDLCITGLSRLTTASKLREITFIAWSVREGQSSKPS